MSESPDRLKKIEDKSEKVGHWIGYWTVRIGVPLIKIGIAYAVVQIAEGKFQTIVVCFLGLIYCGVEAISAAAGINDQVLGYLNTFTSTRIALYLSSEPERRMEDKLDEMVTEISKMKFDHLDPQRTLRRIESGILHVIFLLPLVKICLAYTLN